jgi:hypothetical protein
LVARIEGLTTSQAALPILIGAGIRRHGSSSQLNAKNKAHGATRSQIDQEPEEDGSGDAAAGGSRSPVFFTLMLALLHRLLQFFLVIRKQSMNLAVRFVADSVICGPSCWRKAFGFLSSSARNLIVVLLK